jgi:hypothetical protein
MNRNLLRAITEDEIATYERDGVILLRGHDAIYDPRPATLLLAGDPGKRSAERIHVRPRDLMPVDA